MSAFDELMKEATGGAKGSANGDSGAFESLMKDAQKLPERPDSFFEKVRDYRDKLAGVAKGGADVAVGLVANAATSPLPGLAGIADNQRITEQMQTDPVGAIKSGNMFSPTTPIERAQTVRQVQDAVTVAPFTEQGQQYADYLSEKLAPVAEGLENAQNQMGEVWREDTGSDRVGAVASAIPGAIVEAVPLLGGAKVAGKMSKVRRAPVEREISKELADAAPSGDMLKTESTRHFTDIDEGRYG